MEWSPLAPTDVKDIEKFTKFKALLYKAVNEKLALSARSLSDTVNACNTKVPGVTVKHAACLDDLTQLNNWQLLRSFPPHA
jgi:hypothetical protein